MKFDTEGTYTLQYKAVDECGNETVEDREVIVANPRTVLYTDGTFIINEQPQDMARNTALHGVATNVYEPFDPNGSNQLKKYIFGSDSQRYWHNEQSLITKVIIGSPIRPTSTDHWFQGCYNCTSMDLSALDMSDVTSMSKMFYYCSQLVDLDVSHFVLSKLRQAESAFEHCVLLTELNFPRFSMTSSLTAAQYFFKGCSALKRLDLTSFHTNNADSFLDMFNGCSALEVLDISSFDTTSATNMISMFQGCASLTTIYVSNTFTVERVTNSGNMFASCNNLIGGAGTTWNSTNPKDKTYARIDNPPDAPGYFTLKQA